MVRQIIFVLFVVIGISACKSGDSTLSSLKKIEKNINKNPTTENFDLYFSEASELLSTHQEDKELVKSILKQGTDIAIKHNRYLNASGFLMPLVKDYEDDPERSANLLSLAQMMNSMNKNHAAATLYSGFKQQYPNKEQDPTLEGILGPEHEQMDGFLDTMFNRVFQEPDEFGLNRSNALKFVDVAEAYALAFPASAQSPFYLYRAGEVARSIRTLPKALSIYDWILDSYPTYEKTPTVLFLKGFILENDVQDVELARTVYESFLASYPNHELSPSVKFLIENLGKSDEEILDFIESQRENAPAPDPNS